MPERVWTNSTFGRALCSVLGAFLVVIPFAISPDNGSSRSHGWNAVVAICLIVAGLATLFAVWTLRLVLTDGVLTATNFLVARSMPLLEVTDAEPATIPIFGIKISNADGCAIRTLVSGQSWDELWTPRAARIAEEFLAMAASARQQEA